MANFSFFCYCSQEDKTKGEKKKMKKVLFLIVLVFASFTIIACSSPKAESDGTITLIVLDIDGNELVTDEVDFVEGETFLEVLENSDIDFIITDDAQWGAWLSGINDYTLPSNGYWSILDNGEYATVGISDTQFADGDIFTFALETY